MHLVLWQMTPKVESIDRVKHNWAITSIAWNPASNQLAIMDVEGKVGIWNNSVPSALHPPHTAPPPSAVKLLPPAAIGGSFVRVLALLSLE